MSSRPASRPSAAAATSRDREPPRSARGAATRAKLVAAARTVFERDGFLDSRVTDITAEAQTAAGSFYTYFDSKEEIFAAVLAELQDDMLHQHIREAVETDEPTAIIEASNRAYLLSYQRNAKLMRLLEQVATIDDDFRELRRRRGLAFTERNASSIRTLQARGLADPALNPYLTATALSAMVSRVAYMSFVIGEKWSIDELVAELTRLWINALRIPALSSSASQASEPQCS
jgi:AcrR family transcriptional regulator